MIPYHGWPITPEEASIPVAQGGHAFVSYAHRQGFGTVVELCQSFALDNGAFPAWRKGEPIRDWSPFYEWADECRRIPSCDFAVIPDVIDGSEADNDALVDAWPLPQWFGAPVWHLHESFERLARLVRDWPRVCIGSSGAYSVVGSPTWFDRMFVAMMVVCDEQGRPRAKLHGLRMLNPKVFTRFPFASADSTNIARNVGIDSRWKGTYPPISRVSRAKVLRDRIEYFTAPRVWRPTHEHLPS